MSAALVSILIPTYNGERFLAEALRSALDQTHREIEVLVADDASTDRTPEILAEAAAADPRVRVIRRARNLGAFDNTATLVAEARGEYVKYLLHDDLLAPDCVETLLEGLCSSPSATLAFSHRSIIDADGQPIGDPDADRLLTRTGIVDGKHLGDVVLEFCRNVIGEVTTVLFRRADVDVDTLYRLDGRRLEANADVALWLSLLARGNAFYTPRTLSSFRRHAGQQTSNRRLQASGVREWPLLIDWGRRHGFLADEDDERRAHAEALRVAAAVHAELPSVEAGPALEALYLSVARLVELGSGLPADAGRPLPDRVHGVAVRDRLAQELDVWAQPYPFALAVPAPDAVEVHATIESFRQLRAAGAATRLVLGVDERHLEQVVSFAEGALAEGPDIDVELVPTDDPATLLPSPWLAVAPRGVDWHRGRAAAVWTVLSPPPCV
jgi:glycosyltransferase involved in cell wall biosynthesis